MRFFLHNECPMMRASQFNEGQIIGILREQTTADVCRKHGISSATFYKVEGEVRRAGRPGRAPAEGTRGREPAAEEAVGRGNAGQRDVEGRRLKKMVTPAPRREAATHLCESFEVSQRRACDAI